jgi:hypothetical protein
MPTYSALNRPTATCVRSSGTKRRTSLRTFQRVDMTVPSEIISGHAQQAQLMPLRVFGESDQRIGQCLGDHHETKPCRFDVPGRHRAHPESQLEGFLMVAGAFPGRVDAYYSASCTPCDNHQCVREHCGLVGRSVEPQRVFLVQIQSWRQDYALLSRAREDVATLGSAAIEPIWVIEGAAAQSEDVWKPF